MSASVASRAWWVIVPAAGSGRRMGADQPKQYLPLLGRPVLAHTLERLARLPHLRGLLVGLSEGDTWWPALQLSLPVMPETYIGGAERAATVLNGLDRLEGRAGENDWVFVHDAARPCVRPADVVRLAEAGMKTADGALLGLPVADTVKRADSAQRVLETVPRTNLWRALTPQCFPYGALRHALQQALRDGVTVTDEASAMEYVGARPLMVEGHPDNIKITLPADLALAELYLRRQAAEAA